MIISIKVGEQDVEFDSEKAVDISIPLRFNGPQPNAYGVEPASSRACEAGDIVGDTRRGGSVNFEQYTVIPHCNGTHTECVGHITDERISVTDCLKDVLIAAVLISVEPEKVGEGDLVITRSMVEDGVRDPEAAIANRGALIVRTMPNEDDKLTRAYGDENIPPYFTVESIEYIVESGFRHLLVDLPSIDRIFDDGKLTNHRIFWSVEPGSRETHTATRIYNTITELIYVPNQVPDGEYLLNLQIAPFASDAAPSRPVIFTKK
ncbi:MAG: cyclase family protein [Acidobacteriota bacterium]